MSKFGYIEKFNNKLFELVPLLHNPSCIFCMYHINSMKLQKNGKQQRRLLLLQQNLMIYNSIRGAINQPYVIRRRHRSLLLKQLIEKNALNVDKTKDTHHINPQQIFFLYKINFLSQFIENNVNLNDSSIYCILSVLISIRFPIMFRNINFKMKNALMSLLSFIRFNE